MARNQLVIIAALAAAAGSVDAVELVAVKSGGSDLAFRAIVTVGADAIKVADDAGKVKTFRDADDFIKQAGALGMLTPSKVVTLSGLDLVAPKPFTGDIVKKNEGTVASYIKRANAAIERSGVLAQEIALMANDSTVPQSLKDEKAAQKASVDALQSWLTSEVNRISAILNPGSLG